MSVHTYLISSIIIHFIDVKANSEGLHYADTGPDTYYSEVSKENTAIRIPVSVC